MSLALLTDLYQLTMAYGYWKVGLADARAVFHLFYRKNPFGGGYAICAGLQQAVELIQGWRFTAEDAAYLASLTGNDGAPLFEPGFLRYLQETPFGCDVDAVPEGTAVFPHEPLLRLRGPLIQCQLLETALLTILNFQTLIATKASRVCAEAGGDSVLEFGLRRAQGPDGGLSASRAAYIGGCHATSNVLAGQRFGIPVRGTHAHSWVMTFPDERAAFENYAAAMPNNCVFLVDTYDTLDGVRNAVAVGRDLRARGYEMSGVRLDSGDLAALSVEARRILDEGGFPGAQIVASNDLDEYAVRDLKAQGAKITVWGVGTRLATAYDQPALGGVYKLSAVARPGEPWQHRIKLSEIEAKVSNPGVQQVRRYARPDGALRADLIYDEASPPGPQAVGVSGGADPARHELSGPSEDLLVPVFRDGALAWDAPPISAVRDRALAQLRRLPAEVRALKGAAAYPVLLEEGLHALKLHLMNKHRED